jgi:hypothetical protein
MPLCDQSPPRLEQQVERLQPTTPIIKSGELSIVIIVHLLAIIPIPGLGLHVGSIESSHHGAHGRAPLEGHRGLAPSRVLPPWAPVKHGTRLDLRSAPGNDPFPRGGRESVSCIQALSCIQEPAKEISRLGQRQRQQGQGEGSRVRARGLLEGPWGSGGRSVPSLAHESSRMRAFVKRLELLMSQQKTPGVCLSGTDRREPARAP